MGMEQGTETSKVRVVSDEEESSGPVWRGVLPRRQSAQLADSLASGKERARGQGNCSGRLQQSRGKSSAGQNL